MKTAIYLALKEVWRNRGRFFLFSMVIALISVLILFIAALGEGLGAGNREYLQKLNAELIVYQDTSWLSIASSRIERSELGNIRGVEGVQEVGPVGFASASILLDQGTDFLDISLIGVEPGQPGEPPAVTGRGLVRRSGQEAVIDRTVAEVIGLQPGDTFTIRSPQGTREEFYPLTVAGISDSRKYSLRPSIFVPYIAWDRVRPHGEPNAGQDLASNVVVVKLEDPTQLPVMRERLETRVDGIVVVDRKTAYENTPGYSEQQGTLLAQNSFALLIGLLVIGGFFQIQTLQKVPQIGMLKAIGTPNGIVAIAALIQIMAVTLIGIVIGGLTTVGIALIFPPNIPIIFEPRSGAVALGSILIIGPLGGLVSIRYSLRVEPLTALRLTS